MCRLRGKAQISIIFMTVFTLVVVLYKMSSLASPDDLSKGEPHNRNGYLIGRIENVAESSGFVQNKDNIARQTYDERILSDSNSKQMNSYRSAVHSIKDVPGIRTNNIESNRKQPFKGQKIVHLDLKGAPPKVSYYEELFPLLRLLGATGILVEYEDMFPYSGAILQEVPAYNSYSRGDIKRIVQLAYDSGLQIIPLIQTFGHLEFLLKLIQFSDMREVQRYPQVICPTHNATFSVLTVMIDQIVALHPGIKYLHIGCDEVYYLGECTRCTSLMFEQKWSKTQLFLNHVTRMAKYVREKHPGIIPLVWDDEFRELTVSELKESGVADWAEPVVWKYTSDVSSILTPDLWDKYASVFSVVWIATAFKGATGPDKYLTDIAYHMENHRAWMDIIATQSRKIKIKGVVLTGWQRYDHFAVLCELLPVAIPSLAINLAYIQGDIKDMTEIPKSVTDLLKCDNSLPLSPGSGRSRCSFPGYGILDAAERLYTLYLNMQRFMSASTYKGWLTQYNIEHGFSSPSNVEHATSEIDRCRMELTYIERDMKIAMLEVFDHHTVNEWLQTYITPLVEQLRTLWEAKEKLLIKEHWPRRPLDILQGDNQDL